MITFDWQLTDPINTVICDCDGTLSTLEGIDELARQNGVGQVVESLTAAAMGQTGLGAALYAERLNIVKPTHDQVAALGSLYFQHIVPDADRVLRIFQRLQKNLYIFSAGLYPAVAAFGEKLGVPREHIFAVPVEFAANGSFKQFDPLSPLVHRDGKRVVLHALHKQLEDVLYVGDGLNDYAVHHMVKRFVGYGGVFHHQKLAERCQFYIKSRSLSALLPITLTATEAAGLPPAERSLYDAGLQTLLQGGVILR